MVSNSDPVSLGLFPTCFADFILSSRPSMNISTPAYKRGEAFDHDTIVGAVSLTLIGLSIRKPQRNRQYVSCTPQPTYSSRELNISGQVSISSWRLTLPCDSYTLLGEVICEPVISLGESYTNLTILQTI